MPYWYVHVSQEYFLDANHCINVYNWSAKHSVVMLNFAYTNYLFLSKKV